MRRTDIERPVYPACLLLEGKRCVVVGGGKVAARKVQALRDAGAAVVVVSPALNADLAALAGSGSIAHLARAFKPEDVSGAHLVIAATDKRAVNKQVIACCAAHRILCCSADANWPQADFVSPATLRAHGLVLAVSTGGKSCRRSRMLKESFKRHLDSVANAELLVMGTSHHQLELERREPYHLVGDRLARTGSLLRQIWGVHECALLNTCNRIETLAVVAKDEETEALMVRVMGFDHLGADEWYVKRGHDAFAHVAMVTAGLLSQTPGEQHIVAQVKAAVETAVAAGWAGGMLQEWLATALQLARSIRTTTRPLIREFEIEDSAIEYLAAQRPRLAGTRVLVLGAGDVGAGVVARCVARKMACVWCYHREKPAIDRAWKGAVRLCSFNDLRSRLPVADIVICATSSPGYVLHTGHAPFFDQEKDVLVIDLAMPRNVEPALGSRAPNLRVADLGDLEQWWRRAAADMKGVLERATAVIAAQRDLYDKLMAAFTVS